MGDNRAHNNLRRRRRGTQSPSTNPVHTHANFLIPYYYQMVPSQAPMSNQHLLRISRGTERMMEEQLFRNAPFPERLIALALTAMNVDLICLPMQIVFSIPHTRGGHMFVRRYYLGRERRLQKKTYILNVGR